MPIGDGVRRKEALQRAHEEVGQSDEDALLVEVDPRWPPHVGSSATILPARALAERRLSGRVRNRESAADPPGEKVRNFGMTGNRFGVACAGVLPKGMLLTLSAQHTPVTPQMAEQAVALHPITTSACSASGGMARKESSRRCSKIRAIPSRRFARHSARDLPWPFAPGTSAQYAMYQGPSFSTIAVNSLRMRPFYRCQPDRAGALSNPRATRRGSRRDR